MNGNTNKASCKIEEKHNDATLNRPAGERPIDAPSLLISLPSFIRQIKWEEAWRKNDRNSITVFKTADMCIVLGGLHTGAEMLPHKAEGVMSIQVLEGEIEVHTDELSEHMLQGELVAIHKGCNYRIKAIEESLYLLTITGVDVKGKFDKLIG